ncbi:MAG: hypothetical protein KA953_08730, partial [Lachnospiraceae bacterium]|nr:hypothetical protein [Lachnospiraceae bacterium]
SGSYYKLSKAYYDKQDATDGSKTKIEQKTSDLNLKNTKSASDDLKESTQKLLTKGNDSVFLKSEIKQTDGSTKYDYNRDQIMKSVESFMKDYNELVDTVKDSKSTKILTPAASMTNLTKEMETQLKSIGISISKENRLVMNQDIFSKADVTNIKSLFQGAGSYGYQIQSKAFSIGVATQNEIDKNVIYTGKGTAQSYREPQFDTFF